ncbi:MAG: hypothetical protein LBE83_03265, partial [Propionibacteriaceae bacterium]|nr:hypothetical protein [Propionibacteriaceae bacterium]
MISRWGETLDRDCPLNNYPRPQLRRDNWQCLNGPWQWAIANERPADFTGTITVPYSPEAPLSGVERQLLPGETLWYRRVVAFDPQPGRRLLHFGAVDQSCEVWVNGLSVGDHAGGYWPFYFDVTTAIRPGDNEILVAVRDDSDQGSEAYGKQNLKRGGIWYTAQSGIWQTVWTEVVPPTYIDRIEINPDYDQASVSLRVHLAGDEPGLDEFELTVPEFHPWTPDDPYLYDLEISAGEDRVTTYYALRKISVVEVNGHPRLALNNQPLFQTGLLDQGYYADGLYTAPSDEAMIWELEQIKALGFNMVRKHIKIEPLRWYHHCDRLGLLVWQDFVSGGGPYHDLVTRYLPFIGVRLRDHRHRRFGRRSATGREVFARDLNRTIELLRNSPSVVVWVPFNEGWGQFDAAQTAEEVRRLDPSRLIDHASGW